MRFVYRLHERGRTFSTRPRGADMRVALLREAGAAESVELDFSRVLSVSYSFADEFFGSLSASQASGELPFALTVVGASDEVARVLERAATNRLGAMQSCA